MIGIYAHHHGSGHLHRALAVAAAADDEVTILTSARHDDSVNPDPGRIRILPLPLDHDGTTAAGPAAAGPPSSGQGASGRPVAGAAATTHRAASRAVRGADRPTAGGRLHWVPLRQSGLRRRMALLAEWIDHHQPSVFWTDISVEVTLAARLTGTPVVSTVLPGRREDPPHTLAHSVCSELVAAWPRAVGAPTPAGADRPLVPVGGVSRFADRQPDPAMRGAARPRVLHLRGSGGDVRDGRWDEVRDRLTGSGNPGIDWIDLGGPGGRWVADPWEEICRADVVVSAAGQSSVADIAAADAFLVAVPEERPFGEQDATAAHLDELGLGAVAGRADSVSALTALVSRTLERARSAGGEGSGLRAAWEIDGAADRIASTLAAVAAGPGRADDPLSGIAATIAGLPS